MNQDNPIRGLKANDIICDDYHIIYDVIQDSHEQMPWDFTFYGYTQTKFHLITGDYTLREYKDMLCIERKRTTGEIAQNFGFKSKQFYAELERMQQYRYRYIILEFSEETLSEFPINSGIPRNRHHQLRVSANFLKSCIDKVRTKYDIEVIFAGNRDNATNEAIKIFNQVIKENGDRKTVF